jgi:hypothetical protein
MLGCIKPLSEEPRQMPLTAGATADQPRAGLPYELPDANLPTGMSDQVTYLCEHVAESEQFRGQIETRSIRPRSKQTFSNRYSILTRLSVNSWAEGRGPARRARASVLIA